MTLKEIYEQIKNPIGSLDTIEKLIEKYSESLENGGGFYTTLVHSTEKQYKKREYYSEDQDKLYSYLFNKWKNSIAEMTKDEYVKLFEQRSVESDFLKLHNFLLRVPDVKTMKEANAIFFARREDKELENALDKYRWTAFGEGSGWKHVCSRYLTGKKDKYPSVEHRLYLNLESIDIYKIAQQLVEKCEKQNMPFYFKFSFDTRDDTIVIYSQTDQLEQYIDILEEIKKENPEIISRAKKPPILTGKINEWIGYGSEPQKTPDGKSQSFNGVRSDIIEGVIDRKTKAWINANRKLKIVHQGKKMTFQDYIAKKSTEKLLEIMKKNLKYKVEYAQREHEKFGKSYDVNEIYKNLGYNNTDLESEAVQNYFFRIIKSKLETDLQKVCTGKEEDVETTKINVRGGKQVEFSRHTLEKVIRSLAPSISQNDKDFSKSIQDEIIEQAKKKGIDENKFCFDVEAKKKMMHHYNNQMLHKVKRNPKVKAALEEMRNQAISYMALESQTPSSMNM